MQNTRQKRKTAAYWILIYKKPIINNSGDFCLQKCDKKKGKHRIGDLERISNKVGI